MIECKIEQLGNNCRRETSHCICTDFDVWTKWICYSEINEDNCVVCLKSGNTKIDSVNIGHWAKQSDKRTLQNKA